MRSFAIGTILAAGLACVAAGHASAQSIVRSGQVKVGDIGMGYRTFGEGSPLVLIMGYGSTMELWEPALVESLAARRRVIVFDNRGMGGSEAGTGDFSIARFADDTAGLMEALGVARASVLGWSMGSMVAQELALRHPERVDRLVLYAGHSDASMFPPAEEVMRTLADVSGTPEEQGARFISLLFPPLWLRDNGARVREVFYRPMGRIPGEIVGRQAMAIGAWAGSSARLGSIAAPTLVIAGAEDRLVPPENSRFLASRIPAAKLVMVEGTGHGLMFQDRARFLSEIEDFLGL